MELVNYRITLDTLKNGVQKVLQGFNTGDAYARRIEISLVEGNKLFELTDNIVASMYVQHEDAEQPSINACEISGNKVLYNILPTDINTEGIVSCQLKIIEVVNGVNKVLVSPKFELNIWDSASDDGAEQTPTFTALEVALAEAKAYKDSTITSIYIEEDYTFVVDYADGRQYKSTAIKDALEHIGNVEAYVSRAERAAEDAETAKIYAQTAEVNAETSATNAENAKQYIIDHREELMGSPGVLVTDTEPTDPADRVPILINPNGVFIPIGGGGGSDIDDSQISLTTTYSSQKIVDTLDSYKSEFVTPQQLEDAIGGALNGTY